MRVFDTVYISPAGSKRRDRIEAPNLHELRAIIRKRGGGRVIKAKEKRGQTVGKKKLPERDLQLLMELLATFLPMFNCSFAKHHLRWYRGTRPSTSACPGISWNRTNRGWAQSFCFSLSPSGRQSAGSAPCVCSGASCQASKNLLFVHCQSQ